MLLYSSYVHISDSDVSCLTFGTDDKFFHSQQQLPTDRGLHSPKMTFNPTFSETVNHLYQYLPEMTDAHDDGAHGYDILSVHVD